MTARIFLCVPLVVLLAVPAPAAAQKYTKQTLDMQNVPVPAHPVAQPTAKAEVKTGPRLTLEEFTRQKQANIQKAIDKQIAYLRRLIELASPDDPQLPDYRFRLGELFAEKYRYFINRARSLDEPIWRAEHEGDADTVEPQRREQEGEQQQADQSMQKAVSQFGWACSRTCGRSCVCPPT